ncbi:hypothetical protein [Pantoea stewartii]|uniref:Phage protein n=1 Tax=Pantoea stewartii subsp. stewartii DC283 TaxID=660596 RepID=A0ABM6K801_PANSE|nr:hypothetical protein [Pantoea stewartii]ARF50826.1 hypothetical protein DSJ_16780 [Pantoea stewartii subsp. stewartii DC283]
MLSETTVFIVPQHKIHLFNKAAIKLNEIKPLRVFVYDHRYGSSPDDCMLGDIENLSINSNVVSADFLSNDAWEWAEKELSEELLIPESKPVLLNPDIFNGKDTAMMIIAGLSIALGKSSDNFKRGGKINQSAIIRAAESAINEYGNGVEVTDRAIRDWIRPAIEQYATRLPD